MFGYKELSSPLRFFIFAKANTYINAWKVQKDKFIERLEYTHALDIEKYFMNKFNVLYVDQEDTLWKSQAQILFLKIFPKV